MLATVTGSIRPPHSSAGFSIAEVMITVAGCSLVILALFTSLVAGRNWHTTDSSFLHTRQQVRQMLDHAVKSLRYAGNVRSPATPGGSASFTPGNNPTQRMDFQMALGYNATPVASGGCGGICWGDEAGTNGRWTHYVLDTANRRLVSCSTANSGDTIPNLAACRILAHDVQTYQVTYNHSTNPSARTVTLNLQVLQTSSQQPGGAMGTSSLQTTVRLRNS